MVGRFEFATADRILFGWGTSTELPEIASRFGRRIFVVTSGSARPEALVSRIAEAVNCVRFAVRGEPAVQQVEAGAALARDSACDLVVAIGGGSVIDAGKAIAALMTNPRPVVDYLEVIGAGRPLENDPAPVIAVPTTAGTGAEVTRNAVLFSEAERVKVSLRHPGMLPSMAMVDPALTLGLPPDLTAHTGMDALTQVLEPFVSCRANPVTDAFCRRGLEGASWALQRAFANGEDQAAREEMALVSLLGGLALANAGLGAVHGFAAPLGGWMKAPHGAICAGLLPHVMEMNIRVLRARQPQHPALERYREVATILTRRAEAAPEDGVEWVRALSHRLGVPRLGTFGLKEEEIEYLALLSERASSMRGNPLPLDRPELAAVLRAAR